MPLVAGVDLGSNNFRLLVARKTASGACEEIALENRIVRAGQGIGAGGAVLPEALARVRACLREFREVIDRCGEARVVAALTAAGRDLEGGGAYAELARQLLGAEVFVPTGEEEAKLAFEGAMGTLGLDAGDRVMLDIGGGSSEVVVAFEGGQQFLKSLKIGVVRLTEELRPGDPADLEGLAALKFRAAEVFAALSSDDAFRSLDKGRLARSTLVITAGTALTIAAHVSGRPIRDTRALTGVAVSRGAVDEAAHLFASLEAAKLRALPAIEQGREDVILSGVAILSAFMELCGFAGCVASDGGLAEGLVLGITGGRSAGFRPG